MPGLSRLRRYDSLSSLGAGAKRNSAHGAPPTFARLERQRAAAARRQVADIVPGHARARLGRAFDTVAVAVRCGVRVLRRLCAREETRQALRVFREPRRPSAILERAESIPEQRHAVKTIFLGK